MLKQENKFIAVEANIGAGKSTLLPKLVDALNQFDIVTPFKWEQIQEPLDDPEFLRLLDVFYANPNSTEARLDFQMYITERRSKLVKGLDPKANYVIERSLFSDLIFSQANMLSMECPTGEYLKYFYNIKSRLEEYPFVEACVYLKTNPYISYDRMVSRGRESEMSMPVSYMRDIHLYHEACLPQICREYGSRLMTYEWDTFGDEHQIAMDIINSL